MAIGPIDYASAIPQVDFSQSIAQGIQIGQAFGQLRQQQAQQESARRAAEQYQADIATVMQNPTAQGFANLAMKYPQQREAYKQAWEQQDEVQRKSQGEAALQTAFALESGNVDAAKKVLQTRIEALQNSGEDASHEQLILDTIDNNPNAVRGELLRWAAFTQDPGKFAENFGKLGQEARAAALAPSGLKKSEADADTAVAEAEAKRMATIAQRAGALAQSKNVQPKQVESMFKALAARGVIGKDDLAGYLAVIPSDPKAIPAYLTEIQRAGMKADDLMKFTTPDANARLSSDTQIRTTRMNNNTTLAVQDRIDARNEAKGNLEPTLSPETLKSMAQQYLAGDRTALQNLGRGAQGAANLVALRNAITTEGNARGMDGAAIAAKIADYGGLSAGLRTSAQISARVENAISEAKELAPLAIEASKNVTRSGFLPFGKAQIMFDTQTNDTNLKKFATANNGLVAAYAGAMARGQKPTVSDYDHAREILMAAQSHEAYVATVNQMYAEMEAASRAPQNVREHLRNEIGGGHGGGHGAAAPGVKAGWSVERVN